MNPIKKLKIKYKEWICNQYKKYYGSCDTCHYKKEYMTPVIPNVITESRDISFLEFEQIIHRHEMEHFSIDDLKHEFLKKAYASLEDSIEVFADDDPYYNAKRYRLRLGVAHKRL